ncbi:MAG TPA: hypothetical protein VIM61_13050, partial [Chthoniobacterales bacterium]
MSAATEKSPAVRVFLVIALLAGAGILTATAFHFDGWARQQIVAAQGKGWKKSEAARVQGAVSRYGDWPFLMVFGGAGL